MPFIAVISTVLQYSKKYSNIFLLVPLPKKETNKGKKNRLDSMQRESHYELNACFVVLNLNGLFFIFL